MPSSQYSEKKDVAVTFRTIAHLYDPDDPTPEKDRLLSDRAENMISRVVLDAEDPLHASTKNHLQIYLPNDSLTPGREKDIPAAVKAYFLQRSDEIRQEMRLTQRIGLREIRLTVGVCIPAFFGIVICDRFPHEPVALILQNVLVVLTWVVIWQPFQSLVFDRWTNHEQAKVYLEIAKMDMTVQPAGLG